MTRVIEFKLCNKIIMFKETITFWSFKFKLT